MQRVFCDSCQKEIDDRVYPFEPLLHICEIGEGRYGGYVDRDMNMTSGRTVHYDLCLPCYNRVFNAAFKAFKSFDSTE